MFCSSISSNNEEGEEVKEEGEDEEDEGKEEEDKEEEEVGEEEEERAMSSSGYVRTGSQ